MSRSPRTNYRLGRQTATQSLVSVPSPVELIHVPQADAATADESRVLHVWGSPGQWDAARPWITATLFQECNGVAREEQVQIPWHGRAFQLTEGEVWVRAQVNASANALPVGAVVNATISPGRACEGETFCFRIDGLNNAVSIDPEDPNFGCPFATALLVSGHGSVTPFNVTYFGGFNVTGTDAHMLEIDPRPKVTLNILGAGAANIRWKYFR